jgi:hypothetical protein
MDMGLLGALFSGVGKVAGTAGKAYVGALKGTVHAAAKAVEVADVCAKANELKKLRERAKELYGEEGEKCFDVFRKLSSSDTPPETIMETLQALYGDEVARGVWKLILES